ncbi:MAG TPA: hypothetical protein VHD37_00800 [Candidatus Paceibacterota bacterium]|nr:hypothetical protein [Candidatus Paceibacterota bacterium]
MEAMGSVPRAKLCFIDGASLENMARRRGVRHISAHALFTLLRYQVGHTRCFRQPPTITLKPELASNGNTIGEAFRRHGFDVAGPTRYNEHDDFFLENKICGIQPGQAEEIVIVSSDHRFIVPLREKCRHGMRVVWVAADEIGEKGTPMIGKELRCCLESEFSFFNLTPKLGSLELRQRGLH